MKIRHTAGDESTVPASHATGYIADEVTLDGRDFAALLKMYVERPRDFNAWLVQMTGRFPCNRAGGGS